MALTLDGSLGVTYPSGSGTQAAQSKVLQVVTANTSGTVSTSSTTYIDTGLSCSITPLFSTSKILVMVNHNQPLKNNGNSSDLAMQMLRGATVIYTPAADALNTNSTAQNYGTTMAFNYIDSPATTSTTTYKTQFLMNGSSGIIFCQGNGATIILMEIAA